MKKALSVLLAGAMVASMSVSAFAADVEIGTIYDKDGVANEDIHGKTTYEAFMGDITIDGVLPNAELYVPLGASMDDGKGGADLLATLRNPNTKYYAMTYDDENKLTKVEEVDSISDATHYYLETTTGSTEPTEGDTTAQPAGSPDVGSAEKIPSIAVSLESLTDKDLFKFDVDKDDGSKYVKKISVVDDKKLGKLDRTAYLKIELNESQTVDDLKSTGTVTFKAKKSSADAKVKDEVWNDDQKFEIKYTFWINNVEKKGSDEDADTGDRVFFNPESNEDNTFVWGDDRAAVFFEGNDDASKFYARLQTKADSEIYATYGDPVNADLWFYDFVGNPTVPSTSRATLTLGIPWDEDDDYTPNPEDCYIYEMDADGYLTDVTDRFTYDEENDGSTEIEGWTIKTRTLGTYVISDTELDTTIVEEVDEEEVEENDDDAADTTDGGKEIPNTGSSDMVGAAVVAAIASLAAAGAVAFKKASK